MRVGSFVTVNAQREAAWKATSLLVVEGEWGSTVARIRQRRMAERENSECRIPNEEFA